MAVAAGVHLHGPVGTGLEIRQEYLTHGISLEFAQRHTIPEDLKGDAAQYLIGLSIILEDLQTGVGLVFQDVADRIPADHRGGVGLRVFLPSLWGGQLYDLIGPWFQLGKCKGAACLGGSGVGGSAFDMLDLDFGSGQVVSGGSVDFLYPQFSIRSVPEGNFRHLPLLCHYLLRALVRQQVVFRRDLLGHCVQASLGQWDFNDTVAIGGERTHRTAVRPGHGKDRPGQGSLAPCLQLDDLQAGFSRLLRLTRFSFIRGVRVLAYSSQFHRSCAGSIADIVLQIAVLVLLSTGGVEGHIVIQISAQLDLHAAALPFYTVRRVEHFKGAGKGTAHIFHSELGNRIVVLVYNLGPGRNAGWVCKCHTNLQLVHPGGALYGKYLLEISLTVDVDQIGLLLIRGCRQFGLRIIGLVILHPPLINQLGGGQDLVADGQLGTAEAWCHL